MEYRAFGRTGLKVGVLGFGCGAVGGIMVRGAPADQERTVAKAIAAGINYFDTAVQYGDGVSETNLGRVLKILKPANGSLFSLHAAGSTVISRPPISTLFSPWMAAIAGAAPVNGVWFKSIPDAASNSAPATCAVLPTPQVPKLI